MSGVFKPPRPFVDIPGLVAPRVLGKRQTLSRPSLLHLAGKTPCTLLPPSMPQETPGREPGRIHAAAAFCGGNLEHVQVYNKTGFSLCPERPSANPGLIRHMYSAAKGRDGLKGI